MDFVNVVMDTDSAAYIKKAYREGLPALFPTCVHVMCLAHIMNLIGDSFRKPIVDVNAFVRYFSQNVLFGWWAKSTLYEDAAAAGRYRVRG